MYFVASTIVSIIALAAVLGMLIKMPIFLNRRLVAFGILCVLALVAPAVRGLRTDTQVSDEAKMDQAIKSADAEGKPEDNLRIDAQVNRELGEINGTIINHSAIAYKNVKAKCTFRGQSGKKINVLKIEILKVAKPNSDTRFDGVSAGYIDPQAVQFACIVTDAERSYAASPASS